MRPSRRLPGSPRAKTALRGAVPDIESRLKSGQLEILDHEDWYTRMGKADADATVVGEWDRMRLEQVFTHLFQNAARYAPGSAVSIHVEEEAGRARVTVRDSGPGIPEREHARIFERFTQAEGPRAFAGGFGLGLWLVKQVAEAHGGSVTLASRPGAGAAFTVSLPLR